MPPRQAITQAVGDGRGYQRPSYRAKSNGVTGVMPSGGRVDEQPLKASTATASPNQAQRRKQDRKKGINYQLVTKQTVWCFHVPALCGKSPARMLAMAP